MAKTKLSPRVREKFLEVLEKIRDEDEKYKDLAKKLDVSPACISQYRKGKRVPDITVIIKLSDYTKIPVKYFLSEE